MKGGAGAPLPAHSSSIHSVRIWLSRCGVLVELDGHQVTAQNRSGVLADYRPVIDRLWTGYAPVPGTAARYYLSGNCCSELALYWSETVSRGNQTAKTAKITGVTGGDGFARDCVARHPVLSCCFRLLNGRIEIRQRCRTALVFYSFLRLTSGPREKASASMLLM